ncbi:unnamed protein product, partial [Adineta ricciae]
SHWDYNDNRNRDNRTIEQFDEDDFRINFFDNAACGFDGDSRSRDDPFNYSDGGGNNQQWSEHDRSNYNDGGRYNQQWDGSDQFPYNDRVDYD